MVARELVIRNSPIGHEKFSKNDKEKFSGSGHKKFSGVGHENLFGICHEEFHKIGHEKFSRNVNKKFSRLGRTPVNLLNDLKMIFILIFLSYSSLKTIIRSNFFQNVVFSQISISLSPSLT